MEVIEQNRKLIENHFEFLEKGANESIIQEWIESFGFDDNGNFDLLLFFRSSSISININHLTAGVSIQSVYETIQVVGDALGAINYIPNWMEESNGTMMVVNRNNSEKFNEINGKLDNITFANGNVSERIAAMEVC